MKKNLISIIVVNYNGEKILNRLFESVFKQTYTNWEMIIVDNYSSDSSLEIIKSLVKKDKELHNIQVIELSKNTGFALGNNITIEKAKGNYILFLNTDAFMEPTALEEMLKSILKHNNAAGVNPKLFFDNQKPNKIFDAIGICLDYHCSPFNRGIGQIDLGQYDNEEEIMGVCFACCLINKKIFEKVGNLDATYFAYFEDVDWCIRARKQGYKFYTSPKSVAYHLHSATSNKQTYTWKYYLIFRNYLRTLTKSMGIRSFILITPRKLIDIFKNIFKANDTQIKIVSIKLLLNYIFIDLLRYLLLRKSTQQNFIPDITDDYLFSFSNNESTSFYNPTQGTIFNIKNIGKIVTKVLEQKKQNGLIVEWKKLEKKYYSSFYNKSEWENEFKTFMKKVQISQ